MNNKVKRFILYLAFGLFGFVSQSKAAIITILGSATTDYIQVSTPVINNAIVSFTQITVAAWINPQTGNNIGTVICDLTTGTSANTFRLQFPSAAGSVTRGFWRCTNAAQASTDLNFSLSTGTLNFLVGTYNATGQSSSFYLNGLSSGTVSVSGSLTAFANNNFLMGAQATNGSNPYKGTIENIAVYNRVLTSNEIASMYQAGMKNLIKQGLVFELPFDDNQFPYSKLEGDRLLDISGNGNHATVSNNGGTINGLNGSLVYP